MKPKLNEHHRKTIQTVDTITDWDLVCIACHWDYEPQLPEKQFEGLYRSVYAQSDGYGVPGYVPPQGYDWSGVRDSSEEGKKNMAAAARNYLASIGVKELAWTEKTND